MPPSGGLVLIGRLLAVTLPLWLTWEIAQAPAFRGASPGIVFHLVLCGLAAVGDGVIMLALWGLGALIFSEARWFAPPRVGRYVLILAAAIVVQVVVEWLALRAGWWTYQPWHPLLPGLGIGALPVLAAIAIVPASFALVARWEARA